MCDSIYMFKLLQILGWAEGGGVTESCKHATLRHRSDNVINDNAVVICAEFNTLKFGVINYFTVRQVLGQGTLSEEEGSVQLTSLY